MLKKLTRKRKKELGLAELIAIALGGMVGGGIFAILGISVEHIGNATPIAFLIGGLLAFFAAYSYVKLALLYKDEGATYSFFKKTFPNSKFASSAIGWLVVFGYISTLALYAFTFSTYLCSVLPFENSYWLNKIVAGLIILFFSIINLTSVKGMGRLEDWMVYTKLVLLLFIAGLLAGKGEVENFTPIFESNSSLISILIISSITFVAFEGFQLVIHAYNEMDNPQKNIPRAIYSSIGIATFLYVVLAIGALATIPKELIIQDKEYALAAGAEQILGKVGMFTVIFAALLATSSAINGTLFGASRLIAVIATDGYLPNKLSNRIKVHIPNYAIITMSILSFVLILSGGLQIILEFGSITFIIVSFLIAYANFIKRNETKTHIAIALIAMIGLFIAGGIIFYFEYTENPKQLIYIFSIYFILILGSWLYSKNKAKNELL
ncbi:MAG: amino acid permease [Flavobacteriales bacterium]|nr:amino acid permease [Flavobacteriales bacterium]